MNDKIIKEYQKKRVLKYIIIILSLLIIFLEGLALFKVISYLWGLIPFVINCIVKYFYEKEINKNKKLQEK